MRVYWFFITSGKWRAALALLLAAFAGFGAGALVMMIHRSTREGPPSLGWLVVFLAVGFIQLGCNVGSRYTMSVALHHDVLPTLRQQVIQRFLAAPLRKLEQAGAARLLGASTEDVQLVAFSTLAMLGQAQSICAGVACLAYMAWLSWRLFIVAGMATGIGLASFFALTARAGRIAAQARPAQERAMVDVRTTIEAVKEFKLDPGARSQFLIETFEPDVAAAHRSIVRSGVANAIASSWGSLVILIATGIVLFSGWGGASAYILGGYALAFVYLHTEFRNFTVALHSLRMGDNALRSIDTLVDDQEAEARVGAITTPVAPTWSAIQLSGVSIAYRRGDSPADFTLGPVDLAIHPGEIVFVIGGNGSGKSTFAKLLLGLYDPEGGRIVIDGDPVTRENRAEYRQRFSAVLTDSHVFDRLYGISGDDIDGRANGYLGKLHLDQNVKVKDGAFSTIMLSQGQRRRLALVTAFMEGRSIYVFDEWAANQDREFKEIFYRQLLPELRAKGKTAIVITHDDRYFECADRVLRFESGKIV